MKIYLLLFSFIIFCLFPFLTEAFDDIQGILVYLVDFFNLLTRVAFSLGLFFFFWGLAKFLLNTDNEKAQGDGRRLMLWGVVALFIMASIWGIILLLREDILGGSKWFS